jgi:rare lipoprotein A
MTTSSLAVKILLAITLASLIGGCATRKIVSHPPSSKKYPTTQRPYKINGKTYYPIDSARGYRESGTASWYGKKFHGRKTANGETYNMYAKTAAHKTLPMNTMVLVKNLENGRETVVRINDRGPFSRGRIIDLSYTSANEIDMVRKGTARTQIITLGESTGSGGNRDKLKYQDFDTGDFYIQIGAFLDKNNALNLARLFNSTGMKVTIQPYFSNGKTYHRVQIYAGTSLVLARQFEQQILGRGYSGSFIIAR